VGGFNVLAVIVMSSFGAVPYSGADVTACDNSDVNPFMLALEKGHTEVAKTILEANSDCVASADISVGWALEKNLTAFFKVWQTASPES